jgi:hypothetical protein
MSQLKIDSVFSVNEHGEETVKVEHVLKTLLENPELAEENGSQLLAALQMQGEFFSFFMVSTRNSRFYFPQNRKPKPIK